jgi:hypothetical protein
VRWLEPIAGTALMLLVLADVFLTVLYARAGTGLISDRLARGIWLVLRKVSSRRGSRLLPFCGPMIVVSLLLTWSILLAVGAALIVQPQLGTSITNSNQETPTDFVTALYVAGSSLSIVGGSNFGPQSSGAKLLFLLNSVIGTSVISLTITYLMQIYGALRSRNSLCLKIHALSAETGDAAVLLAHLFANNQLNAGYNSLSELAAEVTETKEAHHFYPVLFYFRFPEPFYAVSRSWLIALDAVSLIRSALPEEADWLKQSGAVVQLWSSGIMLLSTLNNVFVRNEPSAEASDAGQHLWRVRFDNACRRLQDADISLAEDLAYSREAYMEYRKNWDPLVRLLGNAMAYDPGELDTAIQGPQTTPQLRLTGAVSSAEIG